MSESKTSTIAESKSTMEAEANSGSAISVDGGGGNGGSAVSVDSGSGVDNGSGVFNNWGSLEGDDLLVDGTLLVTDMGGGDGVDGLVDDGSWVVGVVAWVGHLVGSDSGDLVEGSGRFPVFSLESEFGNGVGGSSSSGEDGLGDGVWGVDDLSGSLMDGLVAWGNDGGLLDDGALGEDWGLLDDGGLGHNGGSGVDDGSGGKVAG